MSMGYNRNNINNNACWYNRNYNRNRTHINTMVQRERTWDKCNRNRNHTTTTIIIISDFVVIVGKYCEETS